MERSKGLMNMVYYLLDNEQVVSIKVFIIKDW